MQQFNNALASLRSYGPLLLRVLLGVGFLVHGLDKFKNLEGVEMFFSMNGVPMPGFSSVFVAGAEVVAGVALIIGLATRAAALLLAIIIAGAILFVKFDLGFLGGYELDTALIAGLVAVALIGPGALSADEKMGLESVPATA